MAVNPERIKELREGLGLSQSELARRVGVTPQAVQQLEDGKVRDPRYIVALAEILGVPPAGLGRDGGAGTPRESHPIRHEPLGRKDLPVYASAQGGPEGSMVISYDPIEWRERPSILEAVPDAFAMYVINDSMEPRYRQGDLRVNSKEVVLLQYNPRKEIVVPRKDVADLYRVMGAYWSD
jgi:transcriptional regulator with XRE-family HTH domain